MVRTGACEDRNRLFIQSTTDLTCVPSKAYFSDLKEQVGAILLQDTFAGAVKQEYVDSKDEFVIYKKLQREGNCKNITAEDMAAAGTIASTKGNTDNNRAWNLDKWKFLPMLDKGWSLRNDAKWYIAIEADTYVIWPNLVQWLSILNHSAKDHYIGSPMWLDSQGFIYGGSGVLISQPTMHKVVDHIRENSSALQEYTIRAWAGDAILGKAMEDIGAKFTTASREFVRDSIIRADYSYHWCTAAISFHHVMPDEATEFWRYQNKWFAENPRGIMRHRDIFQGFILPKFKATRGNWDNNAQDEVTEEPRSRSPEECKRICLTRSDCVQYKYVERTCFTAKVPQLGEASEGGTADVQSGWLLDRVMAWTEHHAPCGNDEGAWSHE